MPLTKVGELSKRSFYCNTEFCYFLESLLFLRSVIYGEFQTVFVLYESDTSHEVLANRIYLTLWNKEKHTLWKHGGSLNIKCDGNRTRSSERRCLTLVTLGLPFPYELIIMIITLLSAASLLQLSAWHPPNTTFPLPRNVSTEFSNENSQWSFVSKLWRRWENRFLSYCNRYIMMVVLLEAKIYESTASSVWYVNATVLCLNIRGDVKSRRRLRLHFLTSGAEVINNKHWLRKLLWRKVCRRKGYDVFNVTVVGKEKR